MSAAGIDIALSLLLKGEGWVRVLSFFDGTMKNPHPASPYEYIGRGVGHQLALLAEFQIQDHKDLLLIMGIGLIGFWFLVRANRRRVGDTTLAPEEQIERLRQSRGMRGDLETLMEEIEELTKRLGARLDQKSAQVERLIAEADERVAELKRLTGERVTPANPGILGAPPPAPLKFPQHGNLAPMSEDPVSRSVYELFDKGHAPVEIAKRLNEQIGKVELILALRRA